MTELIFDFEACGWLQNRGPLWYIVKAFSLIHPFPVLRRHT